MSSSYAGKPCPKCAHVRAESDTAPDWQCPKCGIAYAKFVEAHSHPTPAVASLRAPESGTGASELDLTGQPEVFITQKFEVAELFGFEPEIVTGFPTYEETRSAMRRRKGAEDSGSWVASCSATGGLLRSIFTTTPVGRCFTPCIPSGSISRVWKYSTRTTASSVLLKEGFHF